MANLIPLGFLSSAAAAAGYTFTTKTTSTAQVWRGAAYSNLSGAKYFLFDASNTGTTTDVYRRSTDGLSWSSGTMPAARQWNRAASSATRLVAGALSNIGAYTDNGTTWTATTIFSSASVNDIIHDGTRFLAVSTSSTEGLAHSTTGASWTTIDTGNGCYAIAFDGSSRYIIVEDVTATTARTCTADPTSAGNWSDITLPSSQQWTGITYGNGTWIAHYSTGYATSTNGTTWTARSFPYSGPRADTANSLYSKIFFFDGLFYAFLPATIDTGNYILVSSTDGITWTDVQTFTGSTVRNISQWAGFGNVIIGAATQTATSGADVYLSGNK